MADGWAWVEAGWWRVPDLEAAGARTAFSSRLGGASVGPFAALNLGSTVGDDAAAVEENRRRFARAAGFRAEAVARARQVHGAEVAVVAAAGGAGEVDGLCTAAPGVVLAISVADCVAVYLTDPIRRAVALCHAGWRGTAARIALRTVAAMGRAFGSRPADLAAAISPSIGPCCYEVDAPVIRAFEDVPAVLRPTDAAHARLDLWAANRGQLLQAGLDPSRVAVAGICTACHPQLLYSHRRDRGRTGRMWAVLWLP